MNSAHSLLLTSTLLGLLAFASPGHAQGSPNLLHLQARVSDSGGTAVNGPVNIQVLIYAVPAGGSALWSETQLVTALSGVVNILLGSSVSIPSSLFDGNTRYLALRVGSDAEMVPRRQIAAVPFATMAGKAAGLDASATLPAGLVNSAAILDGTILTADLANGAVNGSKVAAGAIDTVHIVSNAIGAGAIQTNAVTTAKIGDFQITGVKIAAASIDSTKLAAGSVLTAALGANAVTGAKLAPGSISATHLVNDTITQVQLANSVIGTNELVDGSVTGAKIASGTIASFNLVNDAITALQLADGSVGTAELLDNAVTSAKLGVNSVNSSHLVDGTLAGIDFALPLSLIANHPQDLLHLDNSSFFPPGSALYAEAAGGRAVDALSSMRAFYGYSDGYQLPLYTTGHCVNGVLDGVFPFGDGSSAVFGDSKGLYGLLYGVWGRSASSAGYGVLGWATSVDPGGNATGVVGHSHSGSGSGVYGLSSHSSNGYVPAGVTGHASGTNYGRGVSGYNFATSGFADGIVGGTSSPTGYAMWCQGTLAVTGSKNFVHPHPTDPSREVRFVSLEGNESGTYYRGSSQLVNGTVVIPVPAEFRLVSAKSGLTAQVTPRGPAMLWVESVNLDTVVVRGSADVPFDYFVNGIRQGFENHQAIVANRSFIPEYRGMPFGSQYPDSYRKILVDNGTLNADFTPNEATASQLGWTMRDAKDHPLNQKLPAPAPEEKHEVRR